MNSAKKKSRKAVSPGTPSGKKLIQPTLPFKTVTPRSETSGNTPSTETRKRKLSSAEGEPRQAKINRKDPVQTIEISDVEDDAEHQNSKSLNTITTEEVLTDSKNNTSDKNKVSNNSKKELADKDNKQKPTKKDEPMESGKTPTRKSDRNSSKSITPSTKKRKLSTEKSDSASGFSIKLPVPKKKATTPKAGNKVKNDVSSETTKKLKAEESSSSDVEIVEEVSKEEVNPKNKANNVKEKTDVDDKVTTRKSVEAKKNGNKVDSGKAVKAKNNEESVTINLNCVEPIQDVDNPNNEIKDEIKTDKKEAAVETKTTTASVHTKATPKKKNVDVKKKESKVEMKTDESNEEIKKNKSGDTGETRTTDEKNTEEKVVAGQPNTTTDEIVDLESESDSQNDCKCFLLFLNVHVCFWC